MPFTAEWNISIEKNRDDDGFCERFGRDIELKIDLFILQFTVQGSGKVGNESY